MVQLSPSPALDVSPPPECSEEGKGIQGTSKTGSPKMGSPAGLSSLQLALAASSTTYPGYDMYIEDGLICIKHKIRNLQKKKLKLKDYMNRLKHGQTLNKDQLDAVEKYEEVIHNLAFARELHKTLEDLKQDLLKAQKKVVRKEQVAKVEAERRRLCTVLQVQDLLHSLQQEHVRKDLLSGLNRAPYLPAPELQSLLDLAALLGAKRDKRLSLEDQMERAALVYLDLLEGRDKPVAGSTYKSLKEQLIKLLDCGYFDRVIPPPPSKSLKGVETPAVKKTEASLRAPSLSTLSKLNTNDVPNREFLNRLYLPDTKPSVGSQADKTPPTHNWKAEFQAMKEQEPPDSWDMEFTDKAASPQPVVQKPLRGAVGFVPKVPASVKKPAAGHKQKREKKSKVAQDTKTATRGDTPVEVFNSPSALPKDPILRKQKLEDLMTKICGSYSFMQDSLLDGECSPTKGHPRLGRRASGSPSPLAVMDPRRSPVEVLPKTLHSIQLPARLLPVDDGGKANLTNGDQSLENCDLPFTAEDLALEPLQLPESQAFSSPPLYRRESPISISLEDKTRPQTPVSESGKQSPCNGVVPRPPTVPQERPFSTPPSRRPHSMPPPAPFQNMHSVFKVNAPLPPSGDLDFKCVSSPFSESNVMRFSTASTQTPPEFALPEDDQPAYQSECLVNGQIFLSPSQSGGTAARSGQSYYTRGSARGMTRGGKGLPHSFRSAGWHRGRFDGYRCGLRSPGGSFIHQAHMRDSVPVLYGARETGYQHSYKRGGPGGPRHNSSTGWSDSSLLSSPDREGNYTLVDSALGDSLSVSTMEVPVTPQGHTTTLLPMHLYPLSQPLRVAFTASRTANFTPGTLDQPIAFDLLHSNLGDMFDTHLGRFTCPANGTYVFIFHILKLAVNVPLYVNMMRNEEVMVSAYANDGAPDHETASNHAILPLYQGDQVWLRLHRGAIYGSSWKYSTFSGFLLYQD